MVGIAGSWRFRRTRTESEVEFVLPVWLGRINKEVFNISLPASLVDFRSAGSYHIYDHRSVANTDTRFAPNILGRCTATSLDGVRWAAC